MELEIEQIIKEHTADLLKKAYYLTKDEDFAKDLVQEVFITFWEKKEQITIQSSISNYLTGMLKNRFLKYVASKSRQDKFILQLEQSMQTVERSFIGIIEINEVSKSLNDIIDQLPPLMKKVFLLRDQNYSIKEIAKLLNIAEQTVKSYRSEGKKRIQHQILLRHPEISASLILALSKYLTVL